MHILSHLRGLWMGTAPSTTATPSRKPMGMQVPYRTRTVRTRSLSLGSPMTHISSGAETADVDASSTPGEIGVCHVAKLSAEMLAEIFTVLRAETLPKRSLRWMRILQVCKDWRDVALGMARLWTCVSNAFPPALIDHNLLHSRICPLEVLIARDSLYNIAEYMDIIGAHKDRIETLSAVMSPWEFGVFIRRLDLPIPSIRTVSLELIQQCIVPALPLESFHAAHTVDIKNIPISFTTGVLSMLTSLHVEDINGLPAPETMISILRAAPSLRFLELSGPRCRDKCKSVVELIGTDRTLPIMLHRLEKMILRSEPAFTKDLLSVVSVLPSTEIMMCLPVVSLQGVTHRYLSSALPVSEHMGTLRGLAHVDSLFLKFHDAAPYVVGCRNDDDGDYKPVFTMIIPDTTYPAGKFPCQGVVGSIANAIRHMGIGRNVKLVVLQSDKGHNLDLRPVFQNLPSLETLHVKTHCMNSVFVALRSTYWTGEQEVATCRNLAEIQLHGQPFDEGLVVTLIDCLRRRAELGADRLKVLKLYESKTMRTGYLDMLEDAVELLHCSPDLRVYDIGSTWI